MAKVLGIEVLGWLLVVGGIIAMPLPGPGTLILFAGIVVLSNRYEWARRSREKVKRWVERTTCESVATKYRIAGSVFSALFIMGVGTMVIIDPEVPRGLWFSLPLIEFGPRLPLRGLGPGVPIFVSGLVALALVRYGYVKYGPGTSFHDEHFGKSEK